MVLIRIAALNAGPIFIYIVILFWTEYLFQPNLLFFANVQPNLLADLNGVVWFGFYMLWGGLDWIILSYLM